MSLKEMDAHCCEEMKSHLERKEVGIRYDDRFREYGISIIDGGTAKQCIKYCPWCGKVLPSSLRSEWFELIFDKYELDGPDDPDLPEIMKSGEWWRKKLKNEE